MNKGKAVSVQLEDEPQIVTAMASPAGRLLNNCMATQATPESDKPIQTPLPKMRNSVVTSKPVMSKSFMVYSLCRASSELTAVRWPSHSKINSSMNAMAKTKVPIAMASCGIHKGVASLLVEISLKV